MIRSGTLFDPERLGETALRETHFANPARVVQSWYVAAPSRALRRGEARSFPILNRRIALYRDRSGKVHAVDAVCPHLGADLGQGKVIGDRLQCTFHHWTFGPDGRCLRAPALRSLPDRSARVYPTEERWGVIWIFNGPKPRFDLPSLPAEKPCWIIRLPSQRIRCHPHLVLANGLDATHFSALHRMKFTSPPRLTINDSFRITLTIQGWPQSLIQRLLTGSAGRDIVAQFTTIGASLALAELLEPVRFHLLFSGRPSLEGECETQTILFLPFRSFRGVFKIAALFYSLLMKDRRLLDSLAFSPGFTEQDAGLRAFSERINSWEVG